MHNYDTDKDEFEILFQKMMRPLRGLDSIWNNIQFSDNAQSFGPYYYGYTMTVGPDGRPVVKEYGNVRPELSEAAETREPLVDVIADEKEKALKIVAEMPGLEKEDIKIEVLGKVVQIVAERDQRKYNTKVPINKKVEEGSAKATYSNGILEVKFKLDEQERPKGKTVKVD